MLHPINAKSYMIEGVWPHVRDDDWCGEWKLATRRMDSRITEVSTGPLSRTRRAHAVADDAVDAAPAVADFIAPIVDRRQPVDDAVAWCRHGSVSGRGD